MRINSNIQNNYFKENFAADPQHDKKQGLNVRNMVNDLIE